MEENKMSWKFTFVGLLFLIAFKIVLGFTNPLVFGIEFNWILGFLTGFYLVMVLINLTDAGILPLKRSENK